MSDTINMMAEEFKIAYPLTYEAIYKKGRAAGYSQAETDYHKQTEKDRQSAYDCGYEQGRADVISEFAEWLEMMDYLNRIDVDYGWYDQSYQSICGLTKDEIIEEFNEYVKEKKNDNE